MKKILKILWYAMFEFVGGWEWFNLLARLFAILLSFPALAQPRYNPINPIDFSHLEFNLVESKLAMKLMTISFYVCLTSTFRWFKYFLMRGYIGSATFWIIEFLLYNCVKVRILNDLTALADFKFNQLMSVQPPFWE